MKDTNPDAKPSDWREVKFANDQAARGGVLMRSAIRDYRRLSERMIESVASNLRVLL